METLSPTSMEGSQVALRSSGATSQWPFNATCFDPVLDYENDVADAFKDIEKDHLAKNTSLCALLIGANYSNARESVLNDRETVALLSSPASSRDNELPGLELFAASRLSPGTGAQPPAARNERGRLQLSKQSFRLLLSTFDVPVAFVTALARPYMVCGTGFRRISPQTWDHWCLIPVRTVASCRAQTKDHTNSIAGSNQLDPFNYIHLSGAKADIRGSYIGLFIRRNIRAGRTTIISFNLLDHRLQDLIEEPLSRIRDTTRRSSGAGLAFSPRFIHFIYLSSALRWWNNVLLCFNQELVMHEKQLQREIAAETSAFSSESKDINTSLHIMAAHLHRYKSELHRVECILSELQSPKFDTLDSADGEKTTEEQQDRLKIEQLMTQLSVIMSFSNELERKIHNILTLLFNQIQVTNDRTMQAILTAAQQDNKLSQTLAFQSHELTQSMKNDSVAMKTIAILTMLFLPGTFFAALFAMPFFTQTKYLTTPAQVWIWTILTVIVTLIAFGIFTYINRQTGVAKSSRSAKQDEESGGTESIPLSGQPQSVLAPRTS